MDSVQVYRCMDIGSAKASRAERDVLPHHVVDVVDPDERFSTAEWLAHAEAAIATVEARGRIPLLVGGAGLYLRALTDGLAKLPSADDAMRRQLESEERAQPGSLHARLIDLDPVSASRIQPRDRVRVVRALEIHALTGRPLSSWLAEHASHRPHRAMSTVVLDPPRAQHDVALRGRAEMMLEAGLVEEARTVRARFGNVRPLGAVGYKEAIAFLDGELTEGALVERIVQATRQFARRQRTWWNKAPSPQVVGTPTQAVEALLELTVKR